jgi:hypothetical protein
MKALTLMLTSPILLALLASTLSVSMAAAGPYETRSSRGEIAFDLTPREPTDGRFTIEIRANTHSGDLTDLDLTKIVALEVGDKTYRPVSATTLSGHHSEGSVTFEIAHLPDRFAVTMTGVRKMGQLRFEWP